MLVWPRGQQRAPSPPWLPASRTSSRGAWSDPTRPASRRRTSPQRAPGSSRYSTSETTVPPPGLTVWPASSRLPQETSDKNTQETPAENGDEVKKKKKKILKSTYRCEFSVFQLLDLKTSLRREQVLLYNNVGVLLFPRGSCWLCL